MPTITRQEKELALTEALQSAETQQLEQFIRNRSKELDSDINELRHKLNIDDNSSIENESLQSKVVSSKLNISGAGLVRPRMQTIQHERDMMQAPSQTKKSDQSSVNVEKVNNRNQLVLLLARIKLSMYIQLEI